MERFCFCGIPHVPWYTVGGKQESKKKKRKKSTTRLENIEEDTMYLPGGEQQYSPKYSTVYYTSFFHLF